MNKDIIRYQKAFNTIIERLKDNDKVLAVMVFGSMVTGDLWEESDIDLFIILDKKSSSIKKIYTEEKGVPIHIKLLDSNELNTIYDDDLRGGKTHRIFASSRLVFSKDLSVNSWYDKCRYYPDRDRERWNLVYLGNLFKSIGMCKKYLKNSGFYVAYNAAINIVEDFSKLYINYSGYMISKDAITMATSLNDEFKKIVDSLFFYKENLKEIINKLIKYIEDFLNDNIRKITSILMDYMKEKEILLTSEEIEKDSIFINYNIHMEEILNCLNKLNIIKKSSRKVKVNTGELLFEQNVYFI
ncbi:nucleotidyltransferase domain-containing protein [Clostridium niameyense]|uniref:Nucleotidyltransferase domain-containing protein n=1 Tax=Clostridium niameyense TaxID=1622073 RepID=A0A6M0R601_9CLOT|nr:nucleotidyltransferase domain-containing protein [Clostridium niameyense]NEZ45624.1 nucleotidyltransferase domain-containing protein [Clostridium niameyense]